MPTFAATLDCGGVLTYETRDLVPATGDRVPCRRHGYCVVEGAGAQSCPTPTGVVRSRAPIRSEGELLEFLRDHPVTTVHALRRHRFTLRLVAALQRAGHVDVDSIDGSVTVRSRIGT